MLLNSWLAAPVDGTVPTVIVILGERELQGIDHGTENNVVVVGMTNST
jgi:hypothetical protein